MFPNWIHRVKKYHEVYEEAETQPSEFFLGSGWNKVDSFAVAANLCTVQGEMYLTIGSWQEHSIHLPETELLRLAETTTSDS